MKLYYSPGACSLASHIALREAGLPFELVRASTKTHQLDDGRSYYDINPKGYVPLLELDDGQRLTENPAVLQYIADQAPAKGLAPASDTMARYRLQEWLGFIGTELHKAVFVPMLDEKASEEVKRYSREKLPRRMETLQAHLRGREFLLDEFSIADAYLATILNWAQATQVDLKQWPVVHEYHQRMLQRPSIAKAAGEELAMYKEEVARRKRA